MRIFFYLLIFCCVAVPSTASAQLDAKVNVGSLIFGGINFSGDYILAEQSSVAFGVGYANTDFGSDVFEYRQLRFIPEYRYYFNPRQGADRFFVGGYGKLSFLTAKSDGFEDENATRGALGLLVGNKWVTDGGFLFEINFGLGRAAVFGDDDDDDDDSLETFTSITNVDVRLGLIAGYRF